eukprot:TRINITY_DN24527_c0_g2_i2.p1 TRINITY_DN24527_c0_g2~~TRINITY_DN24527_c0_g2_i2.p1  ORF type:complete len:169 (+),score=26.45 TRINITY_DN24527_c0_g2_i2:256-762(+)
MRHTQPKKQKQKLKLRLADTVNVKPESDDTSPMGHDFLGSWSDSLGNEVFVTPKDTGHLTLVTLVATLSKAPRKDVHLTLRRTPEGKWACGNAVLDANISTRRRLHWVAEDGRRSVWDRPQNRFDECETEVQDGCCGPREEDCSGGSQGFAEMVNSPAAKGGVIRLSF